MRSIYRFHGRTIQSSELFPYVSAFHLLLSRVNVPLKNIRSLYLYGFPKELQLLSVLQKLETIKVDLFLGDNIHAALLELKHLKRLPRLKTITFFVQASRFQMLVNTLGEFDKDDLKKIKSIKLEIEGEVDFSFSAGLSACSNILDKINELNFKSIANEHFLETYLVQMKQLRNLQGLKIYLNSFTKQGAQSLSSLKSLDQLTSLNLSLGQPAEKNALNLPLRYLKLPSSLQNLFLKFPLKIHSFLKQKKGLLQQYEMPNNEGILAWKTSNIFEQDETLLDFFETMKGLKHLDFEILLSEDFRPFYINFFISILKRAVNLISFDLNIEDSSFRNENSRVNTQVQNYWDLPYFLKSCGHMLSLSSFSLNVPFLIFGPMEASLAQKFPKLDAMSLCIHMKEEDEIPTVQESSHHVQRILKTMDISNVTFLHLNFVEKISESELLARFELIKSMKAIKFFSGQFFVPKIRKESVHELGLLIQSLHKLKKLCLKFIDSDREIVTLMNYAKYHRSLQNLLMIFNEAHWIDDDCLLYPLHSSIKGKKY
jgi:hypothetical protein